MEYLEAQKIMWQMLKLAFKLADRKQPTAYTFQNIAWLQRELLEALATDNYTTIYEDGRLVAFATWYKMDKTDLNEYLKQNIPENRFHGSALYVSNAVSEKGYLRQLIKQGRKRTDFNGAMWHREKNHKINIFPKQKGSLCHS